MPFFIESMIFKPLKILINIKNLQSLDINVILCESTTYMLKRWTPDGVKHLRHTYLSYLVFQHSQR